MIGLLQKISLYDYAPIMLGSKFNTIIGNFIRYHADLNPSIPTEFSTAAYRFGHGVLGDDFPTRHANMSIK